MTRQNSHVYDTVQFSQNHWWGKEMAPSSTHHFRTAKPYIKILEADCLYHLLGPRHPKMCLNKINKSRVPTLSLLLFRAQNNVYQNISHMQHLSLSSHIHLFSSHLAQPLLMKYIFSFLLHYPLNLQHIIK
jgi:hypothetical protein